ncbi:hypothetical protein C8F04DRAFT_1256730 [Mycena alexandri]|uniref:F-box domain-containing protein n=1 Tax=Mycena alexandri TaxID=1745969 RepID=A0AAD6T179_9AGAR|nr:hypothetical protein C8F04DRAFT_1256730 [Mycena alexandri]
MSVRAAILLEQKTRTEGKSRTEIQQLIGESHSEIRSVESQIADLESRLASLVERRDRENLVVDALRHLISPIQLPVELLVQIFGFTICKGQQLGRYPHFQDAYRVSHVCSHWREISFSTPHLWTGPVEVDLREDGGADGFRTWLSRSAPMSVPILFRWFPGKDVAHPVLEELLAISPRWRSLCCLRQSAPAWFFMRLAEHTLESLEEVNLGHVPDAVATAALPMFGTAPLLRKLDVVPTSRLDMPWMQLNDLTLRNGAAPDISLDILAQCANLVTASVDTFPWTSMPPSRTEIITLPHLRTLELDFFKRGPESHFMPFLDSLFPWLASTFTAFQLRSPHLTSLELSYASLTSDDLKAVLFHAPLLSDLNLRLCPYCVDDDFILALHYKHDSEPLVPFLRNLFLYGISPTTVSENILVGMIASRWRTDAEEESQSAPMTIPRWTRVELQLQPTSYKFGQKFENLIGNLRRSGLHIEYSGGITR